MPTKTLPLDGEWTLVRVSDNGRHKASVPGCVHTDLMAAGLLPDLDWRDNEDAHQWPVDEDWRYERTFELDAADLALPALRLCCEGLDTLAVVRINGAVVLEADNMFRSWTADLRGAVRAGRNEITVTFPSIVPAMEERWSRHVLYAVNTYDDRFRGRSYLRKMPCAFGWDWGPRAATCGIWKSIRIEKITGPRLTDVRLEQRHGDGVTLSAHAAVERQAHRAPLRLRLRAEHGKESFEAEGDLPAGKRAGALSLDIRRPALWWPNGMGAQPLYSVRVELLDGDGAVLDAWERRVGLRTIALDRHADAWGESFQFLVNGRPVFCKGANWIPVDYYLPRATREPYERLLGDAAAAHMNMIRVWGGGIYENDVFYELCDELGLMVWQDFMFSCSTYPTFDRDWMASVEAEVRDNVRRLRHHPCVALWCGNNEVEQCAVTHEGWTERMMPWWDYCRLFDFKLPEWLESLDPDRPYWPSSAHTPHGKRTDYNNERCGDAHAWYVWFGGRKPEFQRTMGHRFISEYGFQSYLEPRSFAAFTEPADRNLSSYVADFHQRSPDGNRKIFTMLMDWFRVPKNLEETLWMSQVMQATSVRYCAEHARRSQPRMMGQLYWQLNDIWPCQSWSSIDFFGRWKALQYAAKRFNAPLLVSVREDAGAGRASIHLSNHGPEPVEAVVSWRVGDVAGQVLIEGEETVSVAGQDGREVVDLDCRPALQEAGPRRCLVWAEAMVNGDTASRNLAFFVRPKDLELEKPAIDLALAEARDGFRITLTADRPALYVRLELDEGDCRLSDNFFELEARRPYAVAAHPATPCSPEAFRNALRVTDLTRTYS